jgi:hypothetical protein
MKYVWKYYVRSGLVPWINIVFNLFTFPEVMSEIMTNR